MSNAERLSPDRVTSFLNRFERLDGAVIQHVAITPEASLELLVGAYDRSLEYPGQTDAYYKNWRDVRIEVRGALEYRLVLAQDHSEALLDDHLEVHFEGGRTYLIFDPLRREDHSGGDWSLEEVRASSWYIGGESVLWSVEEKEEESASLGA